MDYNFSEIERKWQEFWRDNKIYKTEIDNTKPKFYVLDMFPYPSGAGLHVGHPLGYIASDIYARYKKLKGFNVLHPMGFDSFGLPAEQYAIQTGTHPAKTTAKNIDKYHDQLDKLGLSYDWEREIQTSSPEYYKWTQWTFIKMFNSYFCNTCQKARPIDELIRHFELCGTSEVDVAESKSLNFSSDDWIRMTEKEQQDVLMNYRLVYLDDAIVNWCPELGTVLANDEVSDGCSIRGGYPVIRKSMRQWMLRITAYSERLLEGLDKLDWSDSVKEIQRNWIGKSIGASIVFKIIGCENCVEVFTTRPDTIGGVTFIVLAPEHKLIDSITTKDQKTSVEEYVNCVKNKSDRTRAIEVDKISGVFTGSYCINPITKRKLPIWISDYVLSGYGTGAIMAVPAHDKRDFKFAKYFELPIIQVIDFQSKFDSLIWKDEYSCKTGKIINSGILNGLSIKEAQEKIIGILEELHIGRKKINYRLKDAIFSRQRYWGEPIPIYYKDDIPYPLNEHDLPLKLPEIDEYKPTLNGEPPLARAKDWKTKDGYRLEINTMPGFAGSSGYYFRYEDPTNNKEYFSHDSNNYWGNVDLYIGGSEHATGHLIYSRFWCKFLYDIGLSCKDEPFQRLINQGMIQGRSSFVYRSKNEPVFVSKNKIDSEENYIKMHVDIGLVNNDILDVDGFRNWRNDLRDVKFVFEKDEDGNDIYICGSEVEKMSKSKYNVQNPDDVIEKYGADTLRLYEMFLGPIEQSKPWNVHGIEGSFRFVRKFWKLFYNKNNNFCISEEKANDNELKILHKLIKRVEDGIESLSLNTVVSDFMTCVNELSNIKCNKREILEPLCILISPYTPHITEEIWHLLGHETSIVNSEFPVYDERKTVENSFRCPISFNGRVKLVVELPTNIMNDTKKIKEIVLSMLEVKKWISNKEIINFIYVPNKIINILIK